MSKNDHEVRAKMHPSEHPVPGIHLRKHTRRGKDAVTFIQNVLFGFQQFVVWEDYQKHDFIVLTEQFMKPLKLFPD